MYWLQNVKKMSEDGANTTKLLESEGKRVSGSEDNIEISYFRYSRILLGGKSSI
jgi:hypothetical protein